MPSGADHAPSLAGEALKRAFDIVAALALLVASLPLWVVIAWRIHRDDKGPVFFRQPRLGRGGTPFDMWKFRTMKVSAADLRNPDGSTYNGVDDPRVTSVGRTLRSTSLDELPQLINVIVGDMSLVGPRPDLVDARQHYRPEDHTRLSVRPGITGWAQLNGRNDLPWQARRDLDLEYIRRRSLWLDLAILVRSVPFVLGRRGIFASRS
jgi:undecaprenyl phosphate N,N'-diacetylbacillosamine 1-phosphate transferase